VTQAPDQGRCAAVRVTTGAADVLGGAVTQAFSPSGWTDRGRGAGQGGGSYGGRVDAPREPAPLTVAERWTSGRLVAVVVGSLSVVGIAAGLLLAATD
jgi:hypothetical protein